MLFLQRSGGILSGRASLALDAANIEPPNAVSFRVTTDNTNDIYAVVTPSVEADPSEAQIIAGQNAAGGAATRSDVVLSPSAGQVGLMLGDLDYRTSYKIHIAQNGVVVRSSALDLADCTILMFTGNGQSNWQGREALTGTGFPASTRVWNGSAWVFPTGGTTNQSSANVGPALAFTQDFAADFPLISVYWVDQSITGTALADLSKGNAIFDDAVAVVNAQLTALSGAYFGGVMMMHGEADANPTGIVTYPTLLPQYMADVETDITEADEFTPWIMGEITRDPAPTANGLSILATVNDQRNDRLHTRVASSDGLTTFDGVHYDEASQLVFGSRFYTEYRTALLANQYEIPAAFTVGDWTGSTGASDTEIDIAINTLPFDGSTDLTALQYSTDAGTTYATLLNGINTGTRTLNTLSAGGSIASGQVFTSQIMVRAVNAIGNGPDSDAKSVTAGAGAAAWAPADDYGTASGEIWYHSDAASWLKDGSPAAVDGFIDTFANSAPGTGWAPTEQADNQSQVTRRQVNGVDYALFLDVGQASTFLNATVEEFIDREIWFLHLKNSEDTSYVIFAGVDPGTERISIDNVERLNINGKYGGLSSAAFQVPVNSWCVVRVQMRADGAEMWIDGTSVASVTAAETTIPFEVFGAQRFFGQSELIGGISEIISVEGTAGAQLVTDLEAYLGGLRDTMNGP